MDGLGLVGHELHHSSVGEQALVLVYHKSLRGIPKPNT